MFQFPDITVPESEKKSKDYHLKWAQAVCTSAFTPNWALNYNKLQMLLSFFMDGTGNDLTGYLQSAPDGTAMPGIWTSQNSVKTRIRALIGELEERSYIVKARALNSEAQARKLEEKERLRVKRKLQELRQWIADETGMEVDMAEYVPQSDAELKEYMDLTWKDKNVLILEGALKWIGDRYHADEVRKREFLYQFILGISPVRHEWDGNIPHAVPVEPWKFGFDTNCTNDMLSDSSYFYEIDYLPLATIAQKYGLTMEELKQSYESYGDGSNMPPDSGFASMPGQVVKWYRNEAGTPRGLVVRICWRDYKELSHKHEVKEEYGAEYFQDVTNEPPRKRDKEKIISNKIECWRQATYIGGQFLKDWGECPNQPRELGSLEKSHPPYEVWINEYFNGKWTSMCEQLVGLQLLKDIALYQLQIQMARAVGKVLVFDEAMIPEGMTREGVVRQIKADGVTFVNSKEYQQQTGNMNLFKDFDLGMSQTISQAIQLVAYFDQQIDATSGVSPERQGQIQGSSTSTGTTQAALIQSNMVTAPFFKGFERFWSRVLQQQARLVKIAWADKEQFAPIIGDVGVDFLRDNIDISLDSFDVVVQSLPPTQFDRQTLTQWLTLVVQSDPEFLSDAMSIMLEPDTTVAVREFQRKTKLRRRQLAQQQQQQAEAEQQASEAQQAHEMSLAQMGYQNEQQITQAKEAGKTKNTLIGGRVKLQQEKIKAITK